MNPPPPPKLAKICLCWGSLVTPGVQCSHRFAPHNNATAQLNQSFSSLAAYQARESAAVAAIQHVLSDEAHLEPTALHSTSTRIAALYSALRFGRLHQMPAG